MITQAVTVPAGTPATVTAGEPGTGGAAGQGSASTTGGPLWPVTFQPGQVVVLDPAGSWFAAIGAGNLKSFTAAQKTGGSLGTSN